VAPVATQAAAAAKKSLAPFRFVALAFVIGIGDDAKVWYTTSQLAQTRSRAGSNNDPALSLVLPQNLWVEN
jgi:hypothetical protein